MCCAANAYRKLDRRDKNTKGPWLIACAIRWQSVGAFRFTAAFRQIENVP